ncbi:ATP-binding protein [Streptomyces hoynatensis]|uniref:ATP-binding protein n=1 Tax=Streptomyces hoynatensis TaxID=1141874 RepID=A0A3A9Z735_9ACTN|nr:ATP-binding protein [Streptomyces hoynatensis]RKN44073.1 ATP-binding protein [Streptomyces hoynatensis]
MSPLHGTTPLPGQRAAAPRTQTPRERFELPAVPSSVATARHLTRRLLDRWGLPQATHDTAELVVSELVTNAVVHTPSRRVACRIEFRGDRLRIEVTDEGQGLDGHVPRRAEAHEECGRGLLLLDALSVRWGAVSAEGVDGCTVWAEIWT